MRHRVGLSYAASLAGLGNVAWEGSPLAEIRRSGSFLARQVPQFMRLLESYRHERYAPESFPSVGVLAEWLDSHRPPDAEPGVMHGDCHLNNVLLRRDVPELAAFVDWEMCTIGDPLLDLGWMLVCWPDGPNPLTSAARWPPPVAWRHVQSCSTPIGTRVAAGHRGWTGMSRWPVSSSASSSRAPGRATSRGRRTRKPASGSTRRRRT